MHIVAIIQARMGSTRLPGKVLADLGGRSMLTWVVHRVRRAKLVDAVVVATSTRASDEPIVEQCDHLSVACFRGDEHDVLDRYYRAATAHQAQAVVRITSDCPLIDPDVIDRVVGRFLEQRPDFAANTLRRTYPRGLDTEVMSSAALARAWRDACKPYERTHVTPFIYRHPELFRLLAVTCHHDHSGSRWTVDTPKDLDFVRAVYRRLRGNETFSWHDVCRLLADEPSLTDLNRNVRHKQLLEG